MVFAADQTDRPFTVLVHHHEKPSSEPLREVKVERSTEVPFLVDELVLVSRAFVQIRGDAPETLTDHEPRQGRVRTVGQDASDLEAERPRDRDARDEGTDPAAD